MFRYLLNLALIISLIPGMAFGLEVNGPLNNALMESSASDPVAGLVEGRFYWNSTSKKPLIYNGTSFQEMGSGGGFGINYLADWSNAGNWTCVGDLTLTATQTASDLPREHTSGNGIKIVATASTTQSTADYCYYDFTLDDIDLNRKLNLAFAQKQSGSYVASNLAAIITTQADRTTSIGNPIVSNIPAYDGEFDALGFDTSSTSTLSLVIRATTDMTDSAGIVISDVIVGPGQIQAVPAVGEVVATQPGSGWAVTGPTNATYTVKAYRDAGRVRLDYTIKATGTSAAFSELELRYPTGMTYQSPITQAATDRVHIGSGLIQKNASNTVGLRAYVSGTTTSSFVVRQMTGTPVAVSSVTDSSPVTWTSTNPTILTVSVEFDVAEWAGAPNYAYDGSQAVVHTIAIANSNQTLTSVSGYQLITNFQTIQENIGGGSWSGGRFTVPYAGYYLVTSGIMAAGGNWASSTAFVGSYVFVNGSVAAGLAGGAVARNTEEAHRLGSTVVKLNAGDIVDIRIWSSSTYSATINSTGTLHDRFTISRMADQYGRPVVGFGIAQNGQSGLINYYQSGSNSAAVTGFTTSPNVTVYVTRSGNTVTGVISTLSDIVKNGSAGGIIVPSLIPSWARPTAMITFNATSRINSLYDSNLFRIQTNGDLEMFTRGYGNIAASGTGNGFPFEITFSYVIR